MGIIRQLNKLDTRLFLILNGHHSPFLDPIMYWVSNKWFWLPFYLLMVILIISAYKKRSVLLLITIGILITVSDQLSSHLIKPWVRRLRPSHNPALAGLVHLSKAGPGGMFGFVSGHATNCFALFAFLTLVLDRKYNWLKYILFFWAVLVSYSRIYVGVHYPGDVLGGAVLGNLVGFSLAKLYQWIATKKILTKNQK